MSRIELLREYMKKCGVDACIIPTADPHLSEYVPDCYKLREWLSGFTGSAGVLVVTETKSGLWTDGRYYIQAEKELSGSGITLFKASERDCIKIHTFLQENLPSDSTVGVDGRLFSKKKLDELIAELKKKSLNIDTTFVPHSIWDGRPDEPKEKAFVLSDEYCGESVDEKIKKIRTLMQQESFTHYIVSAPECIMWLLNIRGNDVRCTPVMLSYLILTKNETFIYADKDKITAATENYLKTHNITLKEYDEVFNDIENIGADSLVAADFEMTNYSLVTALKCAYKDRKDFIYNLKCIKSEKEIENIKKAYIKENTALVKSFYHIYSSLDIDECAVASIIQENRKKHHSYVCDSFDTIAAFGKNAAMMHYGAQKGSCAKIKKDGLLLIDTGGQYKEGTTDTTRTLVLGEISEEQRENMTLVLKGNISLSMAIFPDGSRCCDIDALARIPLWKKGLDYRCSTGHGVGYLLGVHEGPQRLSSLCNEKLIPGMTITNEPGVYMENEYGIRIENHLCVREFTQSEYGKFLCFEVLNFCPIGTKHIKAELLDEEQKHWLNSYNMKCAELLKDHLTIEEYQWLIEYTRAI